MQSKLGYGIAELRNEELKALEERRKRKRTVRKKNKSKLLLTT